MKFLVIFFCFQNIVSSQIQPGDSTKKYQTINSINEIFNQNILNYSLADIDVFDRYTANFKSFQYEVVKNRNSICDLNEVKFTDLGNNKSQILNWLNQNNSNNRISELVDYFNQTVSYF